MLSHSLPIPQLVSTYASEHQTMYISSFACLYVRSGGMVPDTQSSEYFIDVELECFSTKSPAGKDCIKEFVKAPSVFERSGRKSWVFIFPPTPGMNDVESVSWN